MTIKEIKQILDEKGIEYTKTMKKAELEALLPTENLEETLVEAEKETETSSKVVVRWELGTREYSKEVHGDNYKELAESFANKKGGELIGS